MSESEFDLVVFGATSFVGQILCRYLLRRQSEGSPLRWAMAGRSQSKLKSVRADLGEAAASFPLISADADDEAALRALCDRTRVVVSTVGPYALYGNTLLRLCAETGTDYCDLTGEPQWIARMLEQHEHTARQSGARIVHCCGFDSIPSDLGLLYTQQQAMERLGDYCKQVRLRVKAMKGGASGGTVASLMNATKEVMADKAVRKLMQNPYALCPADGRPGTRQPLVKAAQFDEMANAWVAPFVMAAINTRVVHRSHALAGYPYGEDFLYDEAMLTGRGWRGGATAAGISAGLGAFMAGAALGPTRKLMEKTFLPAPGEGPSPAAQKAGYWDYRFFGRTADGRSLMTKVTGQGDPGYGSTAKMLGEAGTCLALDIDSEQAGGFWTPATLMGEALTQRLIDYADLQFATLS